VELRGSGRLPAMADKSRDDSTEPSLELPSLFRRKRRAARDETPEAAPETAQEPESVPAPEPAESAPVGTTPVEATPVAEPDDAHTSRRVDAPPEAPTQPLFVDEVEATRRLPTTAAPPDAGQEPPQELVTPPAAERSGPRLPPRLAAVLTGLLVGLAGAGLVFGGFRGCEVVRGTDSCGTPGGLLLVAIVIVMVLIGSVLLAWLRVSDARGTSFLGVGITCVVAMVALLETLFSTWMFVVVPLVSAAAFLLAEWVTTRFVEQPDRGPGVDVR